MRHSIRVTFADGNFLFTEINGTKEEVRQYYLGNREGFQFGDTEEHPGDNLVRAVKVEFLT